MERIIVLFRRVFSTRVVPHGIFVLFFAAVRFVNAIFADLMVVLH